MAKQATGMGLYDLRVNKASYVPTRVNTNLSDWSDLVLKEFKKYDVDPDLVPSLRTQHAWEYGYTPQGFASRVQYMQMQGRRNAHFKSKGE